MGDDWKTMIPTGEATAILPVDGGRRTPITVIGTEAIRATFCDVTLRQAINSRMAPGVEHLVLNPDAHLGYGAPVGSVMVSPSHIYPGPIGVDIKCSMSLLQLDLPADQIEDRATRRAIIDAICERTPTGPGKGQRNVLSIGTPRNGSRSNVTDLPLHELSLQKRALLRGEISYPSAQVIHCAPRPTQQVQTDPPA